MTVQGLPLGQRRIDSKIAAAPTASDNANNVHSRMSGAAGTGWRWLPSEPWLDLSVHSKTDLL
ncbi:hypothetical protein J6590_078938 [Homalodisca vitripennis]|nr:hypothetical protein J6590_078938 [Homalodisca vitripennis]